MSLDPNWFYSSLAQCAAAIVGIVGSVLAVRLQSQLDVARRNAEKAIEDFLLLRGKAISLSTEMVRIAGFVDANLVALEQAITNGDQQIGVKHYATFGSAQSAVVLGVTAETIVEWKERRAAALRIKSILSKIINRRVLQTLSEDYGELINLQKEVPDEARTATKPLAEIVHRGTQTIARHKSQTSTWLAMVLTSVLALLCIFGLILPLAYLSAYEVVHKSWLLTAFAVGVMALPFILAIQIAEVRRTGRLRLPPEDILTNPIG